MEGFGFHCQKNKHRCQVQPVENRHILHKGISTQPSLPETQNKSVYSVAFVQETNETVPFEKWVFFLISHTQYLYPPSLFCSFLTWSHEKSQEFVWDERRVVQNAYDLNPNVNHNFKWNRVHYKMFLYGHIHLIWIITRCHESVLSLSNVFMPFGKF